MTITEETLVNCVHDLKTEACKNCLAYSVCKKIY
jgi:hypothetical protein